MTSTHSAGQSVPDFNRGSGACNCVNVLNLVDYQLVNQYRAATSCKFRG